MSLLAWFFPTLAVIIVLAIIFLRDPITYRYHRIRNAARYFICAYKYDITWDYAGIFDLLKLKLTILEDAMLKDIFADNSERLREINIAIRLLERITDREEVFYGRWYDRHNAKWGMPKYTFEPTTDGTYKPLIEREHVNESNVEIERKEYLAAAMVEQKIRQRDVRNVLGIISKYHEGWWT